MTPLFDKHIIIPDISSDYISMAYDSILENPIDVTDFLAEPIRDSFIDFFNEFD
jgi:hypothetical protein